MNIAAEKINEIAFKDLYNIISDHVWLRPLYGQVVELWNLCDVREQQELLKDLFDRFEFVDGYRLEEIAAEIVEKTCAWGFSAENTFIAAIGDPEEVDGSVAGLQYLKNKYSSNDGWKESCFIPSIVKVANEIRSNDNLILFDDFIGSGKTLNRKLKYFNETLIKRRIKLKSLKVVTFAGMQFGIDDVTAQFGTEVFCPIVLKKGIGEYESSALVEKRTQYMLTLEEKLGAKYRKLRLRDHSLGHGKSEALFQIHGYNCPNNVFPIFWWPIMSDGGSRNTMFSRAR